MTAAITTAGLGKRFGRRWALRECTLSIPRGRVCGLVGANGAGKTTLLRLLAGLARPSAGTAEVTGRQPSDAAAFLSRIGYLGQEAPLYRNWSVADHFRMGARLNPRWDEAAARNRLQQLKIPFDQRVGTLSGGQRAQVALAVALSKRPEVLLLDEPVAALDPLARRTFLSTLAEVVAERDLTVVLSSHLVSDLERICDHVVVLAESQTVLADELDDVLARHRLIVGPQRDTSAVERRHTVLRLDRTPRQVSMLVRLEGPLHDPNWHAQPVGLEEILLAYLGLGSAIEAPLPSGASA